MLQPAPYRTCPACDGDEAKRLDQYSPEAWLLAECDACGFVYLRDPPGYEALEEDFAWEKTYASKKTASKGSTWFSPIGRWLKQKTGYYGRKREAQYASWFSNGHVLDIGCGDGRRIPEPMTPYGIELSTALHRQAQAHMHARGGYCVHGPGAEAIWEFPEAQFDGIIMNSYLEHETEVAKVLEGARRALKDSGNMYVRVPNYASLNRRIIGKTWCGFRHPDHVNYFTPKSLARVAAKAGFSVKITNPLTLRIDDNINALFSPTA